MRPSWFIVVVLLGTGCSTPSPDPIPANHDPFLTKILAASAPDSSPTSLKPPAVTEEVIPRIDPSKIRVPYSLLPNAPFIATLYWDKCQRRKVEEINQTQEAIDEAIVSLKGGPETIERMRSDGRNTDYFESLQKRLEDKIEQAKQELSAKADPYYIAEPPMMSANETSMGTAKGKIIQIIDDQNAIVDLELFSFVQPEHQTVWISGVSTEGQVDGSVVFGCFVVTGTQQYQSLTGQRTVRMLKPFNIRNYLKRE